MELDPGPYALATILDGIQWTQRLNYLGISGITILIWDFLYTFPDEVRLMWPQPLSPLKVLFFFLRYYVMGHMVLLVNYGYPTGVSLERCKVTFIAMTFSSGVLIIASEWILFIRVWAFSGRNKRVLAFLIFQAVAIHGICKVTLVTFFVKSVTFAEVPFDNLPCLPAQSNDKILAGIFGLLLWSLTSVMSIMMWIGYRRHLHLRDTTLLAVFYQDGVFYFVCLSILATVNIIVNTTSKAHGFKYLFTQIEVISHVVLSTRMVIHLRQWSEREACGSTYDVDATHPNHRFPTTIQFRTGKEVETSGSSTVFSVP